MCMSKLLQFIVISTISNGLSTKCRLRVVWNRSYFNEQEDAIATMTWLNSHFFSDAELDNFVGQEPINNNQPQTSSNTYEHSSTNASYQPSENKDTANQPAKQGYFTSIFSSLPNLSLSSSKSDSAGAQISQAAENISGTAQEFNPFALSQGRHGSQPDTPEFLATNSQNISNTDSSRFLAGTSSIPQQSTVPPSASAVGECLELAYKWENYVSQLNNSMIRRQYDITQLQENRINFYRSCIDMH